MNDFGFYFTMGLEHIISKNALDHILFICCIAVLCRPGAYKQLLIMLTAFTIGHSITLFLNIIDVIEVNSYLVELLIPLTIIVSGIVNIFFPALANKQYGFRYFLALVFGLIHGLGYASSLRFMLQQGQGIGFPLLGFNIGLEAGQIIVATCMVGLTLLWSSLFHLKHLYWIRLVSIISILIAGWMLLQRL